MKGFLDDDNWVDNAKSDKHMDKFGAVICILCLCVKRQIRVSFLCREISSRFFVEKNVPFYRLVSKNSIKWYRPTLRNIATRSSLEDRPTRTESSSNYHIHLLSPRSKAIR